MEVFDVERTLTHSGMEVRGGVRKIVRPSAHLMQHDKQEGELCMECCTYEANCQIMPCDHLVVCVGCSQYIECCPKCGVNVDEIQSRIIFSNDKSLQLPLDHNSTHDVGNAIPREQKLNTMEHTQNTSTDSS